MQMVSKQGPHFQNGEWLGLVFSPAPGQCLGVSEFEDLLDDDSTQKRSVSSLKVV